MKHALQTRNNFDLFDVFDDFVRPIFFEENYDLRTNIKETEHTYELDLELPGYKKEEIKVSLESGMTYRNSAVSMGLPGLSEYELLRTDAAAVRAVRNLLDAAR